MKRVIFAVICFIILSVLCFYFFNKDNKCNNSCQFQKDYQIKQNDYDVINNVTLDEINEFEGKKILLLSNDDFKGYTEVLENMLEYANKMGTKIHYFNLKNDNYSLDVSKDILKIDNNSDNKINVPIIISLENNKVILLYKIDKDNENADEEVKKVIDKSLVLHVCTKKTC